jgi:polyisoprenoid-binding protein YceI
MRNRPMMVLCLWLALMAAACSDPSANKPKASVGTAAPESSAPKTGGETLTISPENSKVDFVAAKVTRTHNGSFKQFGGTIDFINGSAEQSVVSVNIDTASVTTDDDQLTGHLKTPDFFDVAKYPKATFVSTKIEPRPDGSGTHTITGNFDLHGVKKSVIFPANIQVTADSVSVNAEFSINRKDFGINYPGKADDLIHDGVVIKLTLKVPRKK